MHSCDSFLFSICEWKIRINVFSFFCYFFSFFPSQFTFPLYFHRGISKSDIKCAISYFFRNAVGYTFPLNWGNLFGLHILSSTMTNLPSVRALYRLWQKLWHYHMHDFRIVIQVLYHAYDSVMLAGRQIVQICNYAARVALLLLTKVYCTY